MHTAEELASGSATLVTLPEVYWRVKVVIDDPDTTYVDLGKVLATDPGMTARVLRLANSAFWGYRGRIESLSRALALLGMFHVHDLVLATSLASAFRRVRPSRMNVARFWKGSLHRALGAGAMARHAQLADAQRPFVEGLLSDIGHLVLYQQLPRLAASALERAQGDLDRLSEIERELIGCDYTEVGGALTAAWGLPECFRIAISAQNRPDQAGVHSLEAALLHIAGRLAECDLQGRDPADGIALDPRALTLAGLTFGQLSQALQETREKLEPMTELLSDAGSAPSTRPSKQRVVAPC
jgi:HD-like signal output (HDOD) protein